METMTITGLESYSANSSFETGNPTLARTLAVAIALAASVVPVAKQENPDLTIRTVIRYETAQSSMIANTQTLDGRWVRLRNKISAFRRLPQGWNGEGTAPPESAHVDAILNALAQLPQDLLLPKPLLSDDGEIGVYWSNGSAFADLTIDADGEMSLYLRNLNEKGGSLTSIAAPYTLDEGVIATLTQHLA